MTIFNAVSPFILLAGFFLPNVAKAKQADHKPSQIQRQEITSIQQFMSALRLPKDCQETLVALDVDNTLLAMDSDIGSDQWFNWQSGLIKSSPAEAVVKSMDDLFDIQYKLFALFPMHPTETQWKEALLSLQKGGCSIVALTSRGPIFRTDTEIELLQAGFWPLIKTIGPPAGYAGTYLPAGFEKPREVSFMNGIMMGSGQSKGLILKDLIARTKTKWSQVILIDDTLKNIENMEKDLGLAVLLRTYWYRHQDQRVQAFEKDKTRALKEWKQVEKILINRE